MEVSLIKVKKIIINSSLIKRNTLEQFLIDGNLQSRKDFEILSKKSEDKFIQIQRILSKMDSHGAHIWNQLPQKRKVIWSIIDKSNEAMCWASWRNSARSIWRNFRRTTRFSSNLELDEMVDILQNLPQQE